MLLGGRKKLCLFGALRPPGAPKKTPAENMSPRVSFSIYAILPDGSQPAGGH